MQRAIFVDPSGRRRRRVQMASGVLLALMGVLGTAFVLSLLLPALIPQWRQGWSDRSLLPRPVARSVALRRYLYRRARAQLLRAIQHERQAIQVEQQGNQQGQHEDGDRPHRSSASAAPIVAAFYAPWQEVGLHTLRANASHLTHLFPVWLNLTPDGQQLDTRPASIKLAPLNQQVLAIAHRAGLQIHPVFSNAGTNGFDAQRAHRLLQSPASQWRIAQSLCHWLLANRFQGVNVDFESLSPADYPHLVAFVRRLRRVLAPAHLQVSVDVEAQMPVSVVRALAESSDFIVLMLYDEHYQSGEPGAIASIGWTDRLLRQVLTQVPAQKVVAGFANYAYDWQRGRRDAEVLSFTQALSRARDNRPDEPPQKVVDFDPVALNTTFEYLDEAGHEHEVWLLDAISFYNQWQVARRYGVRGVSLWVLGLEDPTVWNLLDRQHLMTPDARTLREIHYPFDIEFDGEGEILQLRSAPAKGERTLEIDARTQLCTDVVYQRYPSPYLIERWGYHPHTVALTFDDGPDPRYTPLILNLLRRYHVPATFFVIGLNAERYPELIRRMWQQGHEIGNHTFSHPNMSAISEWRAELELNATQRLLQSLLGRATRLFRPPYDADAEPSTAAEVRPILIATRMGYLTIGELIDPIDWQTEWADGAGHLHRRTGADIAQDVLNQLDSRQGNVILLHDGGGDRSATVEALQILIPELQRRGYRFVPVSALMGVSREQVMPPLTGKERVLAGADALVFTLMFWWQNALIVLLYVSLILGVGRLLWVVPLAVWEARRRVLTAPGLPVEPPLVSVLIAAYNEEPVIARTIETVLHSDYPALEVVVVDDGSQDGTAQVVQQRFGDDPRVRLIGQPNMGKGAALNRALQHAHGEIVVCIDADTQVAPDAIRRLVAHFADPQVGAVAGNIKVGNRQNLLTIWQAIEYITSQNAERRAGALLNAVLVVPGALGAWRRQAVQGAGGYETDTLAEDMDLTWRLRMAGWRIEHEPLAHAYTEAPTTLRAFLRQRFRWSFGTLQCLWKHRRALGRYAWFGWWLLPSVILFQVLFQLVAPFIDLKLFWLLGYGSIGWLQAGLVLHHWAPPADWMAALGRVGLFYSLFYCLELLMAWLAFGLDREPRRLLIWLFWQRLAYRWLLHLVMWRAIAAAIAGTRQSWGKLRRHGTVTVTPASTQKPALD